MSGKRIEFIDLAKGVCIILVTIGHCGVPINIPGFEIVRMPLYFILSGLFYKDYGGLVSLIVKKTNKILLPFLFFYLIAYVVFYILQCFAPSLLVTDARGIFDLFNNRQFFNGPIWFLLALFCCNIYYYFIEQISKGLNVNYFIATSVLSIIGGGIGWYIGSCKIFMPMFADAALTALPFFYMGVVLKKTSILYPNKMDKYNWLWFILAYALSVIISRAFDYRLSLHCNEIEGASTYLLAAISVFAMLMLCKMFKKLPLISYMGRYSLIILCTHHMYYRPVKVILSKIPIENSTYIVALITIMLSVISIPICIKLIPWFVAQKDLIKWNPNA
ncbi:MAG: acyltransferase [Rikenellaceae bacterium]